MRSGLRLVSTPNHAPLRYEQTQKLSIQSEPLANELKATLGATSLPLNIFVNDDRLGFEGFAVNPLDHERDLVVCVESVPVSFERFFGTVKKSA